MSLTQSIFALILLLAGGVAYADEFHFSQLFDGKGQALSSVRSVFNDPQGFLWLGGDAGVYRFDGYDAVKVNSAPTRALYLDDSGRLWSAGTTTLLGLNRDTFKSKPYPQLTNKPDKPEHEIIYDMLQTHSRRHFFATKEGLSEYHLLQDKFSHFTLYYQNRSVAVTALFEASNKRVYVGTDAGLFSLDPQQLSQHFQLGEPLVAKVSVSKIAELADGTILLGTNDGVYLVGEQVKHFVQDSQHKHSLSHNKITALLVDKRQTIWIGTGKGLNIFDRSKGTFKRFYHQKDNPNGISNNYITDIVQDRQDNILIATYSGIHRFARTDVHIHPSTPFEFDDQSINNVWSLAVQTDGERWVGTFGSGLFKTLPNGQVRNYSQNVNDPYSLGNNRISSLKFDRQGVLWVGLTQGLQRYDRIQDRFATIDGIDSGIFDIHPAQNGDIWAAANNGVYHWVKASDQVRHYNKDSAIKLDYKQWVRTVYQQGDIVLAGTDKGLNVVNLAEQQVKVHTDVGSVLKILQDSQGRVWVLAWQGLYLFDFVTKEVAKVDGIVNGDAENGCNAMTEDEAKQLWLVCHNSLRVMDLQSRKLSKIYTVEEGVDLSGFLTGAQSFITAPGGDILLGERKGVSVFKPPALQERTSKAKVRLTQIKFSDESGVLNQLDNPFNFARHNNQPLSAKLQKIEFKFSAMDLVRPKAVGYRYRLFGYEQHFNTTAADNRRAVYTNLPAGDYRFKVWATHPEGDVATTEYDFSIATTPWLSWWAYTFYVVLSLLLLYMLIRLRTRALTKRSMQLEEQVKLRTGQLQQSKQEVEQLMSEREKLVENIYHQTRTPLQIMLGNIDGLLDGSMSIEQYCQKQTHNIHSLVNLTDRILLVTRVGEPLPQTKQSLDLSAMLNTLCLGLADVAAAKGLTFDCVIDNHLQVWGVEGCLLNAFENIIGNSIKYTDKGGIRFTAKREGEQILLQCVDTGIGIPHQALKDIFTRYQRAENAQDREGSGIGLNMVEEAIKDHDGTIELTSELAQGTQVTVTLPSQTASLEQADIDYQQLSAQLATDTEKPTILVVEDNLELAMFMKKLLSVHYQVMMAVNGTDGLLQARSGVPDLIISDVMMPMMDGFELTEQIRQDEICCHIPLLLITAKNDIASREKGFALGANDFINKPFKAPEMLNRVANQLALVAAVKQNIANTNQQLVCDSAGQDRLIARFLSAIEANYQDSELQIKSLCLELHVSNRQLERKVKHFLNMTPNALLNEYRLSRAAELIATGHKPSQVYSSCGFGAHAYFSKRFKQKFGKLPSEYKNDTTDA